MDFWCLDYWVVVNLGLVNLGMVDLSLGFSLNLGILAEIYGINLIFLD